MRHFCASKVVAIFRPAYKSVNRATLQIGKPAVRMPKGAQPKTVF